MKDDRWGLIPLRPPTPAPPSWTALAVFIAGLIALYLVSPVLATLVCLFGPLVWSTFRRARRG